MISKDSSERAATAAAVCAVLGLAAGAGGYIAGAGVLLSRHDPSVLPALLAVASVVSIAAAAGVGRLMSRFSPGRVMPILGAGSAALLVAEWLADDAAPRAVAIAVYVHIAVLGPILVSGFWSVMNERFDPHSARKHFGLISAGASVGGLLGCLLVERLSAQPSRIIAILPVLAALQLLHAWRLRALAASEERAPARAVRLGAAARVLRASPQLRRVALLVFLGAAAAALLDFVFKAGAATTHARADLLHYFATFYTVCAFASVVVQTIAGRVLGEKLGLTGSLGALPAAVATVATAAIPFPGLRVVARATEIVQRGSLFSFGYELLFAPMHEREKRATKTFIDVAVERAGDLAGALLVAALLAAGSARLLLACAAALGALGLIVVWRLRVGQRAALAHHLRARTPAGEGTSSILSRLSLRSPIFLSAAVMHASSRARAETRDPLDRLPDAVAALRSGEAARAVEVLRAAQLPLPLVAYTLPLLGWDEVAPAAAAALAKVAPRVTGQLVDRLVDPDEELAIRRRIPALLEHAPGGLAAWGLTRGLADARFEVRYGCGRGLQRLHKGDATVELDALLLLDAVRRELRRADGLWESWRARLAHVFRLLVLALGDRSLALAFRGVCSDDAALRGTALEYLEGALPADISDALRPFLENAAPRQQRGSS